MALDWIFDQKNFGVYAHFTHRSEPKKFDGPLSIAISIGTEGEYYRQIPFDQMIAEEVDSHLHSDGNTVDALAFLNEIRKIIDEYDARDDWSIQEWERRKNG